MFKFFRNKTNEFEVENIGCVDLGSVDAEKDSNLNNYYQWTISSIEFLKKDCNYIIGTFGVGKSALFKAIQDKKILSKNKDINKHFEKRYHVISINDSLTINGQEKITLENAILYWSLQIAIIVAKNILDIYKDSTEIIELNKYLSDYEELKEEFNIKNWKSFFENCKITPSFTYNNLITALEIQITRSSKKNFKVNDLYKKISETMEKLEKKALIIIDKIDDFVRHQDYENQKIYIQALYEVIEEINNERIKPVLFIREDLYRSIDFSTGYIKANERSCFIKWEINDILILILKRFLINEYFGTKCNKLFYRKKYYQKIKNKLKQKIKPDKYCFENKVHEDISKILYYFLNPVYKKKEFQSVFINELGTGTAGLIPRIILLFFKELVIVQNKYNIENKEKIKKLKTLKGIDGMDYETYDLFREESIEKAIRNVKESARSQIIHSFGEEKFKNAFNEIDRDEEKIVNKERINKLGLTSEEVDFFITKLNALGYMGEDGKINNLYILENKVKDGKTLKTK